MKISWRYLGFFLALALLTGLAFLNPALINNYLIEPATRILWLVLRMFLMIDQSAYWTLLVFAAFVFFLRLIPERDKGPVQKPDLDAPPLEDRVAYWQELLLSAQENPEARFALLQNLKNLRSSTHPAHEEDEEITLPPIQKNVRAGNQTRFDGLLHKIIRLQGSGTRAGELEKCVDQILNSMENQLEIENDRTANDSHER